MLPLQKAQVFACTPKSLRTASNLVWACSFTGILGTLRGGLSEEDLTKLLKKKTPLKPVELKDQAVYTFVCFYLQQIKNNFTHF